jgi:chromosome segregation ATPase
MQAPQVVEYLQEEVTELRKDLTEVKVSQGRIEEKLDGVLTRLDKQNGSMARLQATVNDHDRQLVVIATEAKTNERIFKKYGKPALYILAVIVAGLLGYETKVTDLFNLF